MVYSSPFGSPSLLLPLPPLLLISSPRLLRCFSKQGMFMLASRDVAGSFRADAGRDLIRTARTMDPRNDKVRRERRERRGNREEKRVAPSSLTLNSSKYSRMNPYTHAHASLTLLHTHSTPHTHVPGIRHVHYSSMSPSRAFTVGL